MAAYTANQVSISNGDKAVVIESNESPENVSKGDFLYISGSDPKEINRTYINDNQKHVIELVLNWDSGNKTNQPAIVIPTTVNFRATVDAIQNANLLINDNMQAMSDWQTQEGEITFLGLDGNEYTFPSLTTLKQAVDDSVALADQATERTIAAVTDLRSMDTPALSAPFNESARLDYGYGKEYVAGLPVYGVDFTRSSECYFINKSGQIDKAGIDQPAIGPNGIYLHEANTGEFKFSTDLSSGYFGKSNVSDINDGTLAPFANGVTPTIAHRIVNNAELDEKPTLRRISRSSPSVSGSWCTTVAIIKPDTGVDIKFELYQPGSTRTFTFRVDEEEIIFGGADGGAAEMRTLGDGWFLLSASYLSDYTADAAVKYLYLLSGGYNNGETGGYIAYFQTFNSKTDPRILSITDDSAQTTAATMATLPTSRNLPAPGKSFTVVVDAILEFGNNQSNHLFTIRNSVSDNGYLGIEKAINDTLRLILNLGSWGAINIDLVEKSRCAMVVEVLEGDTSILVYQNGVLKFQTERPGETFDFGTDGSVLLGMNRGSGGILNSQLKNFKILNYAASADEIKSWGAPK